MNDNLKKIEENRKKLSNEKEALDKQIDSLWKLALYEMDQSKYLEYQKQIKSLERKRDAISNFIKTINETSLIYKDILG